MGISSDPPGPPPAGEMFDPTNPFVAPPEPERERTPIDPVARKGLRIVVVVFLVAIVLSAPTIYGVVKLYRHVTRTATTTTLTPAQQAEAHAAAREQQQIAAATSLVGVALPSRPGSPAPALPATGPRHPLPSHQVWGFVPYWYLGPVASSPDLSSFTTVAYYAVDVRTDGSLDETGSGWADLGSADFDSLLSRAHAAGDRVLLTVASDNAAVLDALSVSPMGAADALVPAVVGLLHQYGFDGVDLDLEGHNVQDEAGFATFAEAVADGVHRANAAYEVAIDTYPQSADESSGFFDIGGIAPHVDAFFVMAYDMWQPGIPSANAPLTGTSISVASALETYTTLVPRSKIVLGVPFYGDDWTTGKVGAPSAVGGPVALVYSQIAAGNHPVHWDPATDTVFIEYTYQGEYHETWYDDPLTVALKAALTAQYQVAGIGAWALGMDAPTSGLVAAMLGGSPPVKLPLVPHG